MGTVRDDDLVIEFVPPLIALLLAAERSKGSPLTEDEARDLRDGATCMWVPRSVSEATAAQRGYADLDPEQGWEEWQVVRAQMAEG